VRWTWWVLLWSLVWWLPGLSPAWGQGLDYRVYYRGEEAKLTLKEESGRVYGLRTELINLAGNLWAGAPPAGEKDGSWLPLRRFWEDLGWHVQWVSEVKAIIIGGGEGTVLPEEAGQVMAGALADTQWLTMPSREELSRHLAQFYTPALVAEVLPDAWHFLQQQTDWHSTYRLVDYRGLDRGEDWLLVLVTVEEIPAPGEKPGYFHGMMKLEKLEEGWRIAAQRYFDPPAEPARD